MRGKVVVRIAVVLALLIAAMPLTAQDGDVAEPADAGHPYPSGDERAERARFIDRDGAELVRADYDPPAAEAACKTGLIAACTDLAVSYRWGEGIDRNRPVAEAILRKACNAAEARACAVLGDLLGTHNDPVHQAEAPILFARACRLGLAAACEGAAPAEPAAFESRYRAACDAGGIPACRALAGLLTGETRSTRDRSEALALLDRMCRAGDSASCGDAGAYWLRQASDDGEQRSREYAALGCEAGDAAGCTRLGNAALGQGPGARPAALAWFEKACQSDASVCASADDVRNEPAFTARCGDGDQAGCLGLGLILARSYSDLRDEARGAALLAAACGAGTPGACHPAAEAFLFGRGEPNRGVAAGRADALLARGCQTGERASCEMLAGELAKGNFLPQDTERAASLYLDLCDADQQTACEWLVRENHPAAPLPPAVGYLPPDQTEAEIAETARLAAEERARAAKARSVRQCAVNTVNWEGVEYQDRLCRLVLRAIGGFTVNRVDLAPFQALLWRPAKLGQQTVGFREACGGSVVATGWIITAAHCTFDQGYRIEDHDYRIRLGVIQPAAPEGNTYPIVQVIRHPDYSPTTFQFDIALVQYDPKRGTRGDFAFGARRIAVDRRTLAQRPVRPTPPVFAFGWGRQSLDDPTPAKTLQGVRLELEDAATCTARTAYRDWRKDSVLCAMGANREQACTGDSGGPLVTYEDQRGVPTLIGVVSSGDKCSTTGVPSRYIRIGHPRVQRWLEANLPGFKLSAPANRAR